MRREFFLSFLVRVFLQSLSCELVVPISLAKRQIFRINLKNPPPRAHWREIQTGLKKCAEGFFYPHGAFKLLEKFSIFCGISVKPYIAIHP